MISNKINSFGLNQIQLCELLWGDNFLANCGMNHWSIHPVQPHTEFCNLRTKVRHWAMWICWSTIRLTVVINKLEKSFTNWSLCRVRYLTSITMWHLHCHSGRWFKCPPPILEWRINISRHDDTFPKVLFLYFRLGQLTRRLLALFTLDLWRASLCLEIPKADLMQEQQYR